MGESILRQGDRETPAEAAVLPVTLVLDNLRSAYNVGNLFRAAEAVRATEIIACGYTAAPPHPKLARTARGCDALVPCRHFDSATEAIRALKAEGLAIYGVETVQDAPLYWEAELSFPAAFVLGNEALGISESALSLCDSFVALPALGCKNSINVGNCGAVILFECLRRLWPVITTPGELPQ